MARTTQAIHSILIIERYDGNVVYTFISNDQYLKHECLSILLYVTMSFITPLPPSWHGSALACFMIISCTTGYNNT